VIAGASQGIGRSLALRVADEGLNCILIARRTGPLEALAAEIRAKGKVECVTAGIDLASASAPGQLIAAVGSREVGLYIGNAGADGNGAQFLDRDIRDWTDLIQLNVLTAVRCCHYFGGLMRERRRSGILLVGSGACYGGSSFMAVYSGSKAFEMCFAEGLWVGLRDSGFTFCSAPWARPIRPPFEVCLHRKASRCHRI
jgi:short-subunit dehydrogenase